MTKTLSQTVIVENKTGAGGTLAAAHTARAAPDGYTFLIHHNGMATAPALYRKLPYNPLTDFEYVSQVIDVPMTLLGPQGPAGQGLQRAARLPEGQGDKVNLAHAGLGRRVAPVRHAVPSGGRREHDHRALPGHRAGDECAARRPGRPAVRPDDATTQHIKAGSVKLYGVTTATRLKTLPDAPTLAEQGLKGFEVVVWHGIYAPKGTPKEAIEKFGAALEVGAEGSGRRAAHDRARRGDRRRKTSRALRVCRPG